MALKKRSRVLLGVLAVFLVLLLTAGLIVGRIASLALTDTMQEKYTIVEHEDTFLQTLLKGALFGKEFEVDEAELNTYLNAKYCSEKRPDKRGVDKLRVYFHEGAPAEVYAHVYTQHFEFAVKTDLSLDIDSDTSTVYARLSHAQIGEWKISDDLLHRLLQKIYDSSTNVEVQGTTVILKAEYTYELKNTHLTLRLTQLDPGDGRVTCRTNSLTSEALRAVTDYLRSDEGKAKMGEIYESIKGKIRSWIGLD